MLSRVVHNSQVRTFAAWLRGRLEQNRQQIHDVIVESTPKELDHIISTVNLPKLFTYGNHYVKAQQELGYSTLQYILEQREKDLTIFARAALIHGLMRMSTIKYSKQQMRWATQTFLGAKGEDLTLLKSLLDSSGDYNNLFKLVFIDVTDEKMHKQILSHIHRQAKEQIRLDRAEKKKRIKILSDVDDTLIASGGRFPAGAETRFPRHVLYPGALALFEEIDVASRLSGRPVSSSRRKSIKRLSKQRRKEGEDDAIIDENYNDEDFEHDMSSVYGPEDDDLQNDHAKNLSEMVKVSITLPWKKGGGVHHLLFNASDPISSIQDTIENDYGLPPWKQNLIIQPASSFETRQSWKHGNVAFLSARPHAYKDLTESGSYRKFAKLFATGLMHATPTLLPGSLRSGSAAIMVKIRDQILIYGLDLYDVVTALGSTLAKRTSRKKLRRDRDAVEEDDDEENLRDALITKMSTFGTRQTTNDNWIPVAETKVDRFEKYSRLYPEYGFVFFGDNGQGDLYSAERMCVSKYASKRMHKSFIHRVMPKGSESTLLSSLKKSERNAFWKENNIVFFDTYIGAAIEALESKLIPVRGLYRVAKRGVEEMETLLEDYPAFNFEEAVKHLNKDIDRANEKLAEHGMDPVDGILAY
uniref:Phosphatidate phosphatase APP1 catalytic domain-containing protein n=1 Tax=Aplanochytrium stocchinoi TaxID=215587 RepID=A0A7S3PK64_9STRA